MDVISVVRTCCGSPIDMRHPIGVFLDPTFIEEYSDALDSSPIYNPLLKIIIHPWEPRPSIRIQIQIWRMPVPLAWSSLMGSIVVPSGFCTSGSTSEITLAHGAFGYMCASDDLPDLFVCFFCLRFFLYFFQMNQRELSHCNHHQQELTDCWNQLSTN